MLENKPLTGYPSIDKPWLKFYSTEAINAPLPKATIYEHMHSCNTTHMGRSAINYFGKRISYKKLFDNIASAAAAFASIGVKKGDAVALCMLSMPETVYTVYGLNQLGATANIIEPRTNPSRIRDRINEAGARVLVVVNVFLDKIIEIASETPIEHIIVVPISNSMPSYKRIIVNAKTRGKFPNIPSDSKYTHWAAFTNAAKGYEIPLVPYEENRPAVVIYTGGTTGVPKGAVLTNDGITAMEIQSKYDVPLLYSGRKFLGIMPPFIAYGFVFGMFIPFCAGLEVIQIPNFDPKNFAHLVMEHKPNHIVGVPAFYEALSKSKEVGSKKLDFLMCAITGGDQLLETTEVSINRFLKEHGCKYKIMKGYGMTEMGSAATFTSTNEANVPGSVGIPIHSTTIKVIDHETGDELKYNETGELCITGATMMKEYYGNKAETEKVRRLHPDGKYWIHTGDIGYISETGNVFLKGRIKRMIIRPDGHNVWPSQIEAVITSHPAVAQCCVVGRPSPDTQNGKIPTAYIVINEGFSESHSLLKEIEAFTKKQLPERDTASAFCFIDRLPLTDIGKIDYRALEET